MAQNDLVVVGIDVAKDKVDARIRTVTERRTFPTTASGRRSLIAWLRKHQVGKAVMEASGGYERVWTKALRQAGLEVRIVDPKRVRSFAESAGRLAKNDKIDAEMIAWFAETFSEAPSQVEDPAHEEIKALVKGRKSLIDLRARLEMQKEHETPPLVRKAHARLLKKLAGEIAAIETAIGAKIKATPAFAVRAEIIESVPGFAEATALTLLADDSGKRHGQRCIKGGRRWVRNALYMPCVGAATLNNPVFKAFYQRLIAKGKAPKAALIACMRKLIVILNTMIARGEKWDPKRYRVA